MNRMRINLFEIYESEEEEEEHRERFIVFV